VLVSNNSSLFLSVPYKI